MSAETVTSINTKAAEAVDAIEDGDYATALRKLRAVKALLITLPDGKQADQELKWDRVAIDSLIKDCERQSTAAEVQATGIRRTKLYQQPVSGCCSGDSCCD